jgi:hypothetical protein
MTLPADLVVDMDSVCCTQQLLGNSASGSAWQYYERIAETWGAQNPSKQCLHTVHSVSLRGLVEDCDKYQAAVQLGEVEEVTGDVIPALLTYAELSNAAIMTNRNEDEFKQNPNSRSTSELSTTLIRCRPGRAHGALRFSFTSASDENGVAVAPQVSTSNACAETSQYGWCVQVWYAGSLLHEIRLCPGQRRIIGRGGAPSCIDISKALGPDARFVGRRHLMVSVDKSGDAAAVDLSSKNGTWHDGQPISGILDVGEPVDLYLAQDVVKVTLFPVQDEARA